MVQTSEIDEYVSFVTEKESDFQQQKYENEQQNQKISAAMLAEVHRLKNMLKNRWMNIGRQEKITAVEQ